MACSLLVYGEASFTAEQRMSTYLKKVVVLLLTLAAIQIATGIRTFEAFGFDERLGSYQDDSTSAVLVGHCFVLEAHPNIAPIFRCVRFTPCQEATFLGHIYRGPPQLV